MFWLDDPLEEAEPPVSMGFDEHLHPRDFHGKFAKKLGHLTPAGEAGPTHAVLPDGTRVTAHKAGGFAVTRSGRITRHATAHEASVEALTRSSRGKEPESYGGAQRHASPEAAHAYKTGKTPAAAKHAPPQSSPHVFAAVSAAVKAKGAQDHAAGKVTPESVATGKSKPKPAAAKPQVKAGQLLHGGLGTKENYGPEHVDALRSAIESNRSARKHAPEHATYQLDGEYEALVQNLHHAEKQKTDHGPGEHHYAALAGIGHIGGKVPEGFKVKKAQAPDTYHGKRLQDASAVHSPEGHLLGYVGKVHHEGSAVLAGKIKIGSTNVGTRWASVDAHGNHVETPVGSAKTRLDGLRNLGRGHTQLGTDLKDFRTKIADMSVEDLQKMRHGAMGMSQRFRTLVKAEVERKGGQW